MERPSVLKVVGILVAVSGALSMLVLSAVLGQQSGGGGGPQPGPTPVNGTALALLGVPMDEASQPSTADDDGGAGPASFLTPEISTVIGVAMLILNTLCYSCYLLISKSLVSRGLPPLSVTLHSFIWGTLFIVPISCAFIPVFDPSKVDWWGVLGVLYAGTFAGSVAFVGNTYAARRLSPLSLSIYACFLPVSSAVFAYIFLGKQLEWFNGVCAVLIAAGVLIVAFAKYREQKRAQQAAAQQEGKAGSASAAEPGQDVDELEDRELAAGLAGMDSLALSHVDDAFDDKHMVLGLDEHDFVQPGLSGAPTELASDLPALDAAQRLQGDVDGDDFVT